MKTITVISQPNEGETFDITAEVDGQPVTTGFIFSDQQMNATERRQISREGDIAANIESAVNARPIGCTATCENDVVTLDGEGLEVGYKGEALEIA